MKDFAWRAIRPLVMLVGAGLFWFALIGLSGCAAAPLLGEVTASAERYEPGMGAPLAISYEIGRAALVDIYVLDAAGQRYDLRRAQPRAAASDPYVLRFDGSVPTDDPQIVRRLLPPGQYTLVVAARAASGNATAERRLPLVIGGDAVEPPIIENLMVWPPVISPNADAIDDVAEFTYRLPVSATVNIEVLAPNGEVIPVVTREEEGPYEQRHVWNGKRPNGSLLEAGVYTYTVRAEDTFGNVVQRQGQITLADVGQPEARIVYSMIAPQRVMLGEVITVTIRVRNTGTVPIRTYGPPSGYEYTTDEVFSSVENGIYAAQAGGFWRVGMDWDANSGGGPKRYPYRWSISPRPPAEWAQPFVEDFLYPGEEAEIIGRVRILQRETRMGFYVGLIQDGVGFFQDRTGRTIIDVGF